MLLKAFFRVGCFACIICLCPAAFSANSLFQPVQTYPSGGQGASSIAIADVNNDGKPDAVIATVCLFGGGACGSGQPGQGSVSILLGNGDGTFQPAQSYGSGGNTSRVVAVADVNGDDKFDVLVANECVSDVHCNGYTEGFNGTVGVLLGNGDGTFQPAVSYDSGGRIAIGLAVGDLNGDHKPDFLVTNELSAAGPFGATGTVYLGNGDGTFTRLATPTTGSGVSVVLVDVNGDGRLDFLSARGAFVGVLMGNGDGTFGFEQSYPIPPTRHEAVALALRDINGDSKLDLLALNDCGGSQCNKGRVDILIGNGIGGFQLEAGYSSGGLLATAITVADVNRDGRPDIIAANTCQSSTSCEENEGTGRVGVLLGNGDGTFTGPKRFSSGGLGANSIAIADVNGDGKPDVLVANGCVEGVSTCSVGGGLGVLLALFDTTTSLTSSLNPSIQGQAVTLTATVTSPGFPTGTVTFRSGTTMLGSATLSGGVASITKHNFPAGTLAITATYNGDEHSEKSTSPALMQVVN
jgi:hypothetical protein